MAELSKSIEIQPITSQPPNHDLDDSSQPVSPGCPDVPTVPRQVTDYLPLSLCTMMYCFFPIGLCALLYSIRVREANLLGDQTRAQRASRIACVLNVLAVIFAGITLVVIYFLVRAFNCKKLEDYASAVSASKFALRFIVAAIICCLCLITLIIVVIKVTYAAVSLPLDDSY